MIPALQAFYKTLLMAVISFGGILVYATLLVFISKIVDDLKLDIIFKKVTPLSKLLVTLFVTGMFIAPFSLIYNKLHGILTSDSAPLVRIGQLAEGMVLFFVLYSIYKSFKQPPPDPKQE